MCSVLLLCGAVRAQLSLNWSPWFDSVARRTSNSSTVAISPDQPLCRSDDHVEIFTRRRRSLLQGLDRSLTASQLVHTAVPASCASQRFQRYTVNATAMCGVFAAHARLVGAGQLVSDIVDGLVDGDPHTVGAWLAEMVLTSQINVTAEHILANNAKAYGSLTSSAAPLHGFIWHILAAEMRKTGKSERLVKRASELCYFGMESIDECFHGAGHGILLGIMLRAPEYADFAHCYSACTPQRPKLGKLLHREHVLEALTRCEELASAVGWISKEC